MHKAADDILRHRSAIQTEVYIEYIQTNRLHDYELLRDLISTPTVITKNGINNLINKLFVLCNKS